MSQCRRKEIKLTSLEFGGFDAQIQLHDTALRLAKQAKDVGNVISLSELNQIGTTDAGDHLGALDSIFEIAILIHKPEFERLGPRKHAAIGVIFPIAG